MPLMARAVLIQWRNAAFRCCAVELPTNMYCLCIMQREDRMTQEIVSEIEQNAFHQATWHLEESVRLLNEEARQCLTGSLPHRRILNAIESVRDAIRLIA